MNKTNWFHALITTFLFVAVALPTGNYLASALIGSCLYLGREYTQAERRWGIKYNNGNIDGFGIRELIKPDLWSIDSLLDFIFPIITSVGLYYWFSYYI